jgi:nicotinate-nucleotide adenylyltransferase
MSTARNWVEQSQRNPRLKSEVDCVGRDPICIFGGAFDPIHIGHLLIAEDVRVKKDMARVLFIPCSKPPTKEETEAGAQERLEMVRIAAEGNPFFEVSDIEVIRGGVSFTVDTLRSVRKEFGPERQIYLLMGMDQLNAIESWREPDEIVKMCTILALDRPGWKGRNVPADLASSVEKVDALQIDISSSMVRERLRSGQSVRYMLTKGVLEYIFSKGLYGASGENGAAP